MRPSILNRIEMCECISRYFAFSFLFLLEMKSFFSSLYFYSVFNVHTLIIMVETSGIEPLTSCVQSRRSPS